MILARFTSQRTMWSSYFRVSFTVCIVFPIKIQALNSYEMTYWWMTFPRFVTIVSSTSLCLFSASPECVNLRRRLSRISRVNRHIKMLIKRESQLSRSTDGERKKCEESQCCWNSKKFFAKSRRSRFALSSYHIHPGSSIQFQMKFNSGGNEPQQSWRCFFLCVHLQRSMASKEDFLILFYFTAVWTH